MIVPTAISCAGTNTSLNLGASTRTSPEFGAAESLHDVESRPAGDGQGCQDDEEDTHDVNSPFG